MQATRLAVATIIVALDLVEFFYQASILISDWVVTGDSSSAFQMELLRQVKIHSFMHSQCLVLIRETHFPAHA